MRQSLAHEAARELAGHLVNTIFADSCRCQNQADLVNSHLTLQKIMKIRKTQCDNQNHILSLI